MSRIAQIQDKFRLICDENASVRTFLFDDPSIVNTITNNYYPAVLLKLPQKSNIPDYNKNWELFDLEFYVMKPMWIDGTLSLAEQQDGLKVIAEDIIDEFKFYPQVYQVLGGVDFEYGHDADVNNCLVVRVRFRANVFNCRDNTASGETVTITDNDNALVGTIATRSILQVIAKDLSNVEIDCTYTLANGILTLSGINTATTVSKMIIINNVTTTAQSNELIGAYTLANLCIFGNGTEQISIDNVLSYNTTTGTITFNNDMGSITMRIILIA